MNVLHDLSRILTQIAKGDGDPRVLADTALRLVASLGSPEATGSALTVVRSNAEVEYSVEQTTVGETLAERRKTGAAKPFRCPKMIYDAMVEVLTAGERAVPLDDLVAAVADVMGDTPPAFQVRVPVRLWMQVQPPLIVRNRARYRPVDAKTFAATANELWNSLRK